MFKNYLKVAIRNIIKNRSTSIINIFGLSLGVGCCAIIFSIVKFETSFDDFHRQANQIYRVNLIDKKADGRKFNGNNFYPLGEAIKNDIGSVKLVTSVHCDRVYPYRIDQKNFEGSFAFFVDEDYPRVFDVDWVLGNNNIFSGINNVVLTDEIALKHFGSVEDAIGKVITYKKTIDLIVKGVVKKPPTNTDHPYTMLISYQSLKPYIPDQIGSWEKVGKGATYIVLPKGVSKDDVYNNIESIKSKYLGDERAADVSFFLMPLADNHDANGEFNSFNYDFPMFVLALLTLLAAIVLMVACVNYINLNVAQSLIRAKEIGVRKTFGSRRSQLALQFLTETFIITLLSVLIGMLIAQLGTYQISKLYDAASLKINFFVDQSFLIFFLVATIIVTLLAGGYPAFFISKISPSLALKSKPLTKKIGGLNFRRILVLCQFVVSFSLILITLIIVQHLDSIRKKPLGYDAKEIIFIDFSTPNEKMEVFGQMVLQDPDIKGFSFSSGIYQALVQPELEDDFRLGVSMRSVDEGFLDFYNLKMLSGVNFSKDSTSSNAIIVNGAFCKKMNTTIREIVGRTVYINDEAFNIIGVVSDFDASVENETLFVLENNQSKFSSASIRLHKDKIQETLSVIEAKWNKVYPLDLFKYQFLDEFFKKQFGLFDFLSIFLFSFSFLSITLGCIALYTLVTYSSLQERKQICIRKVFGASDNKILVKFLWRFLSLVCISFIVATPLAYYSSKMLLMEFPEREEPGLGIFIVTLLGILLMTLFTIGYRSFVTSRSNPVVFLQQD